MNFQQNLDKLISKLEESGTVPSLLLHSCCAPCSTYCIEYLSKYFKITVFYYNPNIFPEEEYEFRKAEQKRFIETFGTANPVDFIEGDYDSEKFYEMARGYEDTPEGGERCERCFRLRLGQTAKLANEKGYDYFATTLTISPLKNAEVLNRLGAEVAESFGSGRAAESGLQNEDDKGEGTETFGSIYLPTDFKKKNGYLRSTQISREYGMYRQDFCGCEFSLRDSKSREPFVSGCRIPENRVGR